MAIKPNSFPKLPKLVNSKPGGSRIYTKTIDTSVANFAKRLEGGKSKGLFSLDLVDDPAASYMIDVAGGGAKVSKGHDEAKSTFHIETNKTTWLDITTGRVNPVMAYMQGRMRISGDMGFIKRVYAMAAKTEIQDFNF